MARDPDDTHGNGPAVGGTVGTRTLEVRIEYLVFGSLMVGLYAAFLLALTALATVDPGNTVLAGLALGLVIGLIGAGFVIIRFK